MSGIAFYTGKEPMNLLLFVKSAILLYGVIFTFIFVRDCLRHRGDFRPGRTLPLAVIGFVSDLFDTWGIGSFAICQSAFKFTRSCRDELMPGTLNVAHTLPTILEFLLFLNLIKISGVTLIALIAGAVAGAVFGASIVSKWPVRIVRISLGTALLILAVILSLKLFHIGPFESTLSPREIVSHLDDSGIAIVNPDQWIHYVENRDIVPQEKKAIFQDPSVTERELTHVASVLKESGKTRIPAEDLSFAISENLVYGLNGIRLVIGTLGNMVLGALMTIGVGLYAPCMALVSALGMNVTACFPIMMGSCAFLMPSAGLKFLKEGKYDRKAAVLISIFGLAGVYIAYKVASSLPMQLLTAGIICVMIYTAFVFFRSAREES